MPDEILLHRPRAPLSVFFGHRALSVPLGSPPRSGRVEAEEPPHERVRTPRVARDGPSVRRSDTTIRRAQLFSGD